MKTDVIIRTIGERVKKVSQFYEDQLLRGVKANDYHDCRSAAACVTSAVINKRSQEYNNRTLLHLIATQTAPNTVTAAVGQKITQLLMRFQADVFELLILYDESAVPHRLWDRGSLTDQMCIALVPICSARP